MLKIEQMVQAKLTTAKQANWEEKQVALTLSGGHTLAYETTYIITLGGVNQYFIYIYLAIPENHCATGSYAII